MQEQSRSHAGPVFAFGAMPQHCSAVGLEQSLEERPIAFASTFLQDHVAIHAAHESGRVFAELPDDDLGVKLPIIWSAQGSGVDDWHVDEAHGGEFVYGVRLNRIFVLCAEINDHFKIEGPVYPAQVIVAC